MTIRRMMRRSTGRRFGRGRDVQALRQHLFERLELPAGAELVLSSWRRLEG